MATDKKLPRYEVMRAFYLAQDSIAVVGQVLEIESAPLATDLVNAGRIEPTTKPVGMPKPPKAEKPAPDA